MWEYRRYRNLPPKSSRSTNRFDKIFYQHHLLFRSNQRLARSAAASLGLSPLLGPGADIIPPDGETEGAVDAGVERLCAMCALTRCPAARAAHRESSPARTAPPMIRASRREFSPGVVGCEPRTPSMSSIAPWGSRIVPPPNVPTSMDGMETEI